MISGDFNIDKYELSFLIQNYERFENGEIYNVYVKRLFSLTLYQFVFFLQEIFLLYEIRENSLLSKVLYLNGQNHNNNLPLYFYSDLKDFSKVFYFDISRIKLGCDLRVLSFLDFKVLVDESIKRELLDFLDIKQMENTDSILFEIDFEAPYYFIDKKKNRIITFSDIEEKYQHWIRKETKYSGRSLHFIDRDKPNEFADIKDYVLNKIKIGGGFSDFTEKDYTVCYEPFLENTFRSYDLNFTDEFTAFKSLYNNLQGLKGKYRNLIHNLLTTVPFQTNCHFMTAFIDETILIYEDQNEYGESLDVVNSMGIPELIKYLRDELHMYAQKLNYKWLREFNPAENLFKKSFLINNTEMTSYSPLIFNNELKFY